MGKAPVGMVNKALVKEGTAGFTKKRHQDGAPDWIMCPGSASNNLKDGLGGRGGVHPSGTAVVQIRAPNVGPQESSFTEKKD